MHTPTYPFLPCVLLLTLRCVALTLWLWLHRCLRNGRLVQSGTHEGLMQMEGDYQELYKIQALAFSSVHPHPERPLEEQSA